MKQVLIVEDQRMPRENMERVISESNNYEFGGKRKWGGCRPCYM